MKYLIVILFVMSFFVYANAQTCQRHDCSDDVQGVYGNELMRWSPVSDLAVCVDGCVAHQNCYEVGWYEGATVTQTVKRICGFITINNAGVEKYHPPNTCFNPYAVEEDFFPRYNILYNYKVRSCMGDECGEWSTDYVEFKGGDYICFNGCNGQITCYAGYVTPLPEMPYCE